MNQLEVDMVEFLINNREDINSYLSTEMFPIHNASRIFDNHPDIQEEFLADRQLGLLYNYLQDHFTELNFETFSLLFNTQNVKIYLQS